MHAESQRIYDELMTLVETNEAFFFTDQVMEGVTYRIFNYRMASYTDFMLPSALECRGIMFEMDDFVEDEAVRLASRPMSKFFNRFENPMTMDLDMNDITSIDLKADGSLISTYCHDGFLKVKSKGSLASDQAVDATKWLDLPENKRFKKDLWELTVMLNCTVNMEWCAPHNRIVLGYDKPQLTVLNVRKNISGDYVDKELIHKNNLISVCYNWIEQLEIERERLVEWADSIPQMEGIEGYIIRLGDLWVKVKTEWYLVQHRAKDSINSPRRLYEAVLAEATDDLRTLFHKEPEVISRIEEMELYVDKIYNHLVDSVDRYYKANRTLDRKSYAIKAQEELDKHGFGFAMRLYTGKPVDYKGYMIKKWKEFGVTDTPEDDE